MSDFTDERIATARARCEAATFGGGASLPFWQAVWGFYDMLDGQLPMPEQRRDDILYDYGCKAQEMESEYKHALDALAEARRELARTVEVDDKLVAKLREKIEFYEQLAQSSAHVNQKQLQQICTLMNERDEAAQEAHNTLVALVEARRERDAAEALLLALHKAHHNDQGLEWKVDNLLHERGLLENGQ